jgi:iron complex outermembrane receptor protein
LTTDSAHRHAAAANSFPGTRVIPRGRAGERDDGKLVVMSRLRRRGLATALVVVAWAAAGRPARASPQPPDAGIVTVFVHDAAGRPVARTDVQAGTVKGRTGDDGRVTLAVPAGEVDIIATRAGFDPAAASLVVTAGRASAIDMELRPQSELAETIVVSATRANRRIEDEPLRVEVVPQEEVQEKIAMAPGDVSMLLAETNGLRVQSTSPSLGGATIRIQGLAGRYSQVLADGLPLYGGQSGAIGVLQIPPLDLEQVEVIKGVASALYGMSAIGGVINLVSRRPVPGAPVREVLLNRTTRKGTDGALWIAQALNERWGVTLLGGLHAQDRSDLDGDHWTDLPMFRRLQARPRLMWSDGTGNSLLFTVGGMTEQRRGGSMPGTTLATGLSQPEHLDTTRIDGGFVGRFVTSGGRIVTVRASAVSQRYDRTFGATTERSDKSTWFGETSVTGTARRQTWVGGVAVQRDTFQSPDVDRFDYRYTAVGLFGQDDFAWHRRLVVSASGRIDAHNEFGTFVSPKLSLLGRLGRGFTTRASVGRGHIAPTVFTEETEATGLAPVAPLDGVRPETATNLSTDVTWQRGPVEGTVTVFTSRIRDPLRFQELESGPFGGRIVNATRPTRTAGSEFIGRFHRDDFDVILSHMFVWSTESDLEGGVREVALNPRHSATLDVLWEFSASHVGFEVFYTGRQALEDNPYRTRSVPYLLWGALYTHRVGPALLYVNAENLGDIRQTRYDPLLRPRPLRDGRWSTDAWAPLDGRTINAGLRFRF